MAIEFDLAEVERLAGLGLTQEQIALSLGCSLSTIEKRIQTDTGFREAYKKGQAGGISAVANALWDNAIGGNVAAQIFFMKARAQWRDKPADGGEESEAAPDGVSVDVKDGRKTNA